MASRSRLERVFARIVALRFPILVVYAVLVGIFAILEHVIEGLFHHKSLAASIEEFLSQGVYEILGRTLIVFVAFIPFFTLWELDRVLGERKLVGLLFHKGATPAER